MYGVTSTLKFVVLVFNVLCAKLGLITFTLFGLAVRSLGSNQNSTYYLCIFGIVVGFITFLVSLFGCYSTYREGCGYMWTYAFLLALLLVTQLAILITFHSEEFVKNGTDAVKKLWQEEVDGIPRSMANLESDLECCGLCGPEDYRYINHTIPISCYSHNGKNTDLFEEGCLKKAKSFYVDAGKLINATIWSLCGIEATALIIACVLARSFCRHLRQSYETIL